VLDLDQGRMSGSLTAEWAQLTHLKQLVLTGNWITGLLVFGVDPCLDDSPFSLLLLTMAAAMELHCTSRVVFHAMVVFHSRVPGLAPDMLLHCCRHLACRAGRYGVIGGAPA